MHGDLDIIRQLIAIKNINGKIFRLHISKNTFHEEWILKLALESGAT